MIDGRPAIRIVDAPDSLLGILPGDLMSDHKPGKVDGAILLAHEL
jgi:hypothetical protein